MKPTPKQLTYLRTLADRAGQTFTYPRSAAHASREIARLQACRPSSPTERARERRDIQRAMNTRGGDPLTALAQQRHDDE